MDLYKELSVQPIRFEPDVWISRVVIFEKLLPEPVKIRDIALTRGLNIIWAEEPEDDESTTEISGHSAGKTTFCRFLRYILGERTFGTKTNMALIRRSMPDGYVAAEIHVAGSKWAVRRPFGSGRMSYIQENATIEELLKQGGSVSQDEYPKRLGFDKLLHKMESAAVVRTGESIEWGHVLAWCARDQEARFQNIYDWRSPRSESETPAFRFSKVGPLFLMRMVLGLFLPDELKGEEKLAELQRKKELLEKEIEEKRREPDYWKNHYDNELRRRLASLLPREKNIITVPLHSGNLLPDLHRLTEHAFSDIQRDIQGLEKERNAFQSQIDEIGAQIGQYQEKYEILKVLFEMNASGAGQDLEYSLSKREEVRKKIEKLKNSKCIYGAVLFGDCIHVQEQQKILPMTMLQDERAMKEVKEKQAQENDGIEKEISDLLESIEPLRLQRSVLQAKRDELNANLLVKQREQNDLRQSREALEIWMKRRETGEGYQALAVLRQRLEQVENEIEKYEKELTNLLRQHDMNRDRLASIFSGAVRAVLPYGRYDGKVSLDSRELAFRVTHGPAMSGEAVETLSVLLADIVSLIHNTVCDRACLPGFLLHDSPREADLGLRIYKAFIRFVASLQQHFGSPDKCPFQYILTTTTPPPVELQDERFVKLQLNAAKPSGLLLGRNIATMIPNDTDLSLFKE